VNVNGYSSCRRRPSVHTARRRQIRRLALAIGAVAALAASSAITTAHAQAPEPAADINAGHNVAINTCSLCHVAAKDQPFAPMLLHPAPNFRDLADRPSTDAQSLRQFLTTTHMDLATARGMPNPMLTDDQLRDVIAYLLSLRTRR